MAISSLVVLAGCSGDPLPSRATGTGPSGPAATAEFDDVTGAITGTVVDQEANPLEGAIVVVRPSERNVTTASDGSFAFGHLSPGTYVAYASKLEYGLGIQSVQVVAGRSADITIRISPVPVQHPRTEVLGPYNGHFQCRWGTPIAAGPCGYAGFCVLSLCPNTSAVTNVVWANDRNAFVFELTSDNWQEIVFETRWVPTSTATNPHLRQVFSYIDRTPNHWFARTNGSYSPIQWSFIKGTPFPDHQLPEGQPQSPGANMTLVTWMTVLSNINFDKFQPVGLALDQRYEMYVSVFYDQRSPPEYSAFPR